MNYAFVFGETAYGPDGPIKDVAGNPLHPSEADAYNRELEKQEIQWLRTRPDHVLLYVRTRSQAPPEITTWLGTNVATDVYVGPRRHMGFDSQRRAVRCRISGAPYDGWYFESSGDYCRLKKAKSWRRGEGR